MPSHLEDFAQDQCPLLVRTTCCCTGHVGAPGIVD